MPVSHNMSEIRDNYEEFITKGLDCIREKDMRAMINTKARIEHLLRILAPMPKTLEVTKMSSSLFYMKKNLTTSIDLHQL